METLAALVALAGIAFILFGQLVFLVMAFRTSILWGIGVLVFPIVSLIFLILEWDRAKRPFFLQLWGLAFVLVAALALHWRP